MCSDDDDDVVDRCFERRRLWRWREFDGRFWADRYRRKIELKLDADGKPIYDEDAWGMSIETQTSLGVSVVIRGDGKMFHDASCRMPVLNWGQTGFLPLKYVFDKK